MIDLEIRCVEGVTFTLEFRDEDQRADLTKKIMLAIESGTPIRVTTRRGEAILNPAHIVYVL